VDCKNQELNQGQATRQILSRKPDIIGITAPFSFDLTSAVQLSKRLRQRRYPGLIVAGGHPPTFSFKNLLNHFPEIDVAVRGEGEATFLELVQRVEKGLDWRDVEGIAFRQDGEVVQTAPRPMRMDLDSIPFPARDNVESAGEPSAVGWFRKRNLAPGTVILSSRGCPFRCTYCSVQNFYRISPGRPWRMRSAENVLEELTQLPEKWGIRTIRFSDDNFFGSCRKGRRRAGELATLMIRNKLDVNFIIECCVGDVDHSLFGLLKQAGLVRVNIGVESGVPNMLERFGKFADVEGNERAITVLRDLGIDYHPNFILVDPDSTLGELRQNLDFFKKTRVFLAPLALHILYSNRLGLFSGTASLEHYQAQGRTKPWRFPNLNSEEQRITDSLGMLFDYEDGDPEVTKFLKLNNRVMSKLTHQDESLADVERELIRSRSGSAQAAAWTAAVDGGRLLPLVKRWRSNAGKLALRLYEKALLRVEQGMVQDDTLDQQVEELWSEIDLYGSRHFGTTADELVGSLQASPAA
jgi:radical SAM superfamily enzyme YgiQ (UPF0313 family)